MRLITSDEDLAEGADWLSRTDTRFGPALAVVGPLPLRLRPAGFPALLDAIVSQQVSVAASRAIWARLAAAGLTDAATVATSDEDTLRACGLSRPKARYALALARSDVDHAALQDAPDADVIAALVALPGIGRWTAEVYGMFSLGRADMFAAGDLALQEAARLLFDLPERPNERALRAMAETWSPWRAVAARALWAYYRHVKSREGIR